MPGNESNVGREEPDQRSHTFDVLFAITAPYQVQWGTGIREDDIPQVNHARIDKMDDDIAVGMPGRVDDLDVFSVKS